MEILNSITTSESGAKEKLENVKNLLRILQSQKDVCHSLTKDSTVMSSLMKTALRCGKADEEQAVACKLWECIYSLSVESRDNALMLVAAFTELADSTLDFLTSEIPENVRSLVIESLVVVSQHLTDSQRDVSTPPLVHLLITATLNPSIDSSAQKQLVQGLVKIVSTPNLSQLCTTHTNFSNVMRCIGSSNDSLRSVTTALLIRLYELSNDTTRSAFIKTVQELVGRWIGSVSATDKTCGFRLLTGLFHTHTQTGVETLYSLQHDIVSILETIDMESDEVQLAVVDGMSAGCVSDTCRDLFKRNCPQFLESIAQRESDSELKRTSLAVLSKLLVGGGAGGTGKGGVSVDGLVESCIASLLMNETTTTKTDPRKHLSTIEALVMLTAAGHPKLKNKLCSHSQLLSRLISLGLESKGESTLQFGVCSVFLNLAMYPKRLSAEEEQVIKLRRMAKDSSVSQNDEEVEPDADVEKRNVALVNAGLVPLLVSLSSSKPSENLSITLSLLFLTLATTPSNRGKMVQQGSLKALQTLIRHCSTPTGDQPNDAIVKNASHALSKILISVDPNVAFKGVNEAIECVGPLLKLCTGAFYLPHIREYKNSHDLLV